MPKNVKRVLAVTAQPDIDLIRNEELNGVDHLVIPLVMLVEGVIFPSNAESPELALAEEFGRYPQGWNGRPVVFNHPKDGNAPVSANDVKVFESEALGMLFNTSLKDGKLKSEMWINSERLEEADDDAKEAVTRLQESKELTEVSTGVFVTLENIQGVFDGEPFQGIWRSVVPDHLAILPKGTTGACSVADGCGAPRANENPNGGLSSEILPYSEDFFINSTEDMSKGLAANGSDLLASAEFIINEHVALNSEDKLTAIESAFMQFEDFFWIAAVFDDVFVFTSNGRTLMQKSYSINEDGSITIGAEAIQVRPQTTFVPVIAKQEDTPMNKETRVNALIASEANNFADTDRDFLMTLEDGQLEKMESIKPGEVAPAGDVATTIVVTPNVNGAPNQAAIDALLKDNAETVKPKTTEEFLADAPSEVQAVLRQGLQMHASRKTSLITGITANESNQFTADELDAMSLESLEKLGNLAQLPRYDGQGAAELRDNAESDDDAIPAAPAVFPTE